MAKKPLALLIAGLLTLAGGAPLALAATETAATAAANRTVFMKSLVTAGRGRRQRWDQWRPALASSRSLTLGLTNLVTSPPKSAISLTSFDAIA